MLIISNPIDLSKILFTSRVSVTLSGNQAIPATTDTKVAFDTEDYDVNDEFASNRFTAKKAGFYHVDTQIYMLFVAVDISCTCKLFKNGAEIRYKHKMSDDDRASNPNISADVYLAVDDYLEIFVYQDDVISRSLISNSAVWLNIHRFA